MALQTSGAIAINDLATEFGGNAPHAVNEYYRGGGLVPDTGTNSGIPTSGQVDLNDFYGGDVVSGPLPGSLWTWGDNGGTKFPFTALGDGTTGDGTHKSSPVQTIAGGTNWISCRSFNGACDGFKTDGRLWGWGANSSGQIGDNTFIHKSSPVQTISGGTDWVGNYENIGAGYGGNTRGAIKTDGRLWLWGNYSGLGNGFVNQQSPVQTISAGTNWNFIASNNSSTGIKTDGRLWMWGSNYRGQIGDNTQTVRSSPVQTIAGGTNWVRSGCTYTTSGAIKTDGRLWMWGQNLNQYNAAISGMIGDNTTTNRSSPVQTISGGTNWKDITTAVSTTHAVKTDGRLWGWGWGAAGELGNNSNVPRSSPVQTISGGTDWARSSCGLYSSQALKTDGRLWGWGDNGSGQLGDNSIVTKNSPVQTISGGTNWVYAAAGSTSVAIRT